MINRGLTHRLWLHLLRAGEAKTVAELTAELKADRCDVSGTLFSLVRRESVSRKEGEVWGKPLFFVTYGSRMPVDVTLREVEDALVFLGVKGLRTERETA